MAYTNSSLVNYTKLSPNYTSGRDQIDTITIHCVVGQCSVETLGAIFAQASKSASSNYGVGYDGRIGMYVEEKNRSWCSSSGINDRRAITIEVASDTTHPYAVNDVAYNATIKLVADICKRNNIKELKWSTNRADRVGHMNGCNMTVHRDFANKACPGDYLYNRMGEIAEKVNAILNGSEVPTTATQTSTSTTATRPTLSKGSYGTYTKELQNRLLELGYDLGSYGADGSFGNATLTAVKLFQEANGLTVDGIVGPATWAALDSAEAKKYTSPSEKYGVIKFGSTNKDAVKVLQSALVKAGYSLTIDGVFGYSTRWSVYHFQRKNGLEVDGIVGPKTWEKLEQYL